MVDVAKAVDALKLVASSSITTAKGIVSVETLAKDVSDAQNMLGELCEMGLHDGADGSADMTQALEWYRKALKNGNDRSMFNLAAIYEKGEVVPRDMDKAIRLYVEAGKKGAQEAITRLEELEELGIRN